MPLVVAQSTDVILVMRTVDHRFPLKNTAKCVFLGAPCCSKCATWRLMDATVHVRGLYVVPCPIDSPLDSFFCIIKKRLTKVAAEQVAGDDVVDWIGWVPTKNWISCRVKGV